MTFGTSLVNWLRSLVSWVKSSLGWSKLTTGTPTIDRWLNSTSNFEVPLVNQSRDMPDDSQAQDSRVDYVLGLGKTRLRAQVFQLDAIIKSCKYEIDYLVKENIRLADLLAGSTSKDNERLDILIGKQMEILDARLGLNIPPPAAPVNMRPVGKNRNWQ